MTDNLRYWLWLNKVFGAGYDLGKFIYPGDSIEEFYNLKDEDWAYLGISEKKIAQMKEIKVTDFEDLINTCRRYNIHILTPDNAYYPQELLTLNDYPAVLYLRGDRRVFYKREMIAVIGSRTPCLYGEEAAREIAGGLARKGRVVVSGGALGIDSVAHISAMEEGGQTVLVLGHGFGHIYLPENAEMRKKIASNGAIITEYPPFTPPMGGSFQKRNRLISGISKGVVIVEAAEGSGTFSTARHAVKQDRQVFALPGDVNSGNFSGSNRLITEGAKAIFSSEDILAYFYPDKYKPLYNREIKTGDTFVGIDADSSYSKVVKDKQKKGRKIRDSISSKTQDDTKTEKISSEEEKNSKINLESISKNALIVYNIMSEGVTDLEEIKRQSGLEIRKVLASLTELELENIAYSDGPNIYKLK